MVKTDFYKQLPNDTMLVKTFSTSGFYIKKSNEEFLYVDAVDIGYYDEETQQYFPLNKQYTETEILIEQPAETPHEVPDNENRTR